MRAIAVAAIAAFSLSCGSAPQSTTTDAPQAPTEDSPSPTPAETEPAASDTVLGFCFRNAERFGPESPVAAGVVERAVTTARRLGFEPHHVRVGACDQSPAPNVSGCYGRPGFALCSIEDLWLLSASAGFYEGLTESDGVGVADERLRTRGALAPGDAVVGLLRMRSSDRPESHRATIRDWLRTDLSLSEQQLEALLTDAEATASASENQLTDDASWLMYAFLLGHEIFHVRGESCVIDAPARTEQSESFRFAVDSMGNRQLFCPKPVAANELRADRCGLRTVHSLGAEGVAPQKLETVVQVASEVLGSALMTDFARNVPASEESWFIQTMEGYLHPVLRTALVLEELRGLVQSEPGPVLCDRLARNTVFGLQRELRSCWDDVEGDVDDRILALLPDTVAAAWSGEAWTPEAFYCPRH